MRKTTLVAAAVAAAALALAALAALTSGARADDGTAFTYAIYGDAPYGSFNGDTTEMLKTPAFIGSVNSDPDVTRVVHVGDIHSGKDHCYQAYNTHVYDLWQGIPFNLNGTDVNSPGFDDPLVYTPGDNEWTDCNKTGEGGGAIGDGYYDASQPGHLPGDPLDNLAIVRSQFFASPGQTLGTNPTTVVSQATAGPKKYRSFVENVRWEQGGAMFVTLNLPGGSNNDATPWYLAAAASQRQLDEKALRTAADLQWLSDAYDVAESHGDRGLVIITQADMWDPEAGEPGGAGLDQYNGIIDKVAQETRAFDGQVLMLNGDSHVFQVGNPLSSDSSLFKYHPQKKSVPNFTRIVVHGSTLPLEWLKLTIDTSTPDVFTWQEMPQP